MGNSLLTQYLKISSLNVMHELSITQSILSIVLEQTEAARANKITRINLTIGELAGIVGECVEFYFKSAKIPSLPERNLSSNNHQSVSAAVIALPLFTPIT